MRVLAILAVALPMAYSQVGDLATNLDGSTLLFGSRFRLQREADVRGEAKIYRWRGGEWSRLGVAPVGGTVIPANINEPFVAGDGSVFGWQVFPGLGLFPPVQIFAQAEVHGVALPADFPREYLRVSADGRYFVGSPVLDVPRVGGAALGGPQWLDVRTGERRALPEWARMAVVASDGSAVFVRESAGGVTACGGRVEGAMRESGVLVGKGGLFGNTLRIKPPMCITAADVDFTLEVLDAALTRVER